MVHGPPPSGAPSSGVVVPRTSRPATSAMPTAAARAAIRRCRVGLTTAQATDPDRHGHADGAGARAETPAGRAPRPSHRPPATRYGACQPAVTSGRSLSRVLAPTIPRLWSSSTVANGVSARASRIFWTVTGPDSGQGVELVRRRAVEVHGPGRGAGTSRPARRRAAAVGAVDPGCIVARRDPDPVAVLERGREVELRSAPAVSTRGPYPPAAVSRSPTRDPAGSRKTPGSTTAPTTSTTTMPAAGRGAPSPSVSATRPLAPGDPMASGSPPSIGHRALPAAAERQHERRRREGDGADAEQAIRRAPGGTPPGARSGGVAVGAVVRRRLERAPGWGRRSVPRRSPRRADRRETPRRGDVSPRWGALPDAARRRAPP